MPHLAGAIDILAVLQPDGSVKTSPFYVRFGKYSGFREKHRRVSISVNGIPQSYAMQVGRTGEAYFVEEVEQPLAEGEGVDDAVLGGIDSPPQGYSDDDEGESTSLPPVPSALGRGGTPYASPLRHGEVKRSASEPSLSTLDGTKGEERGHSEAQPSQGLPLPHGSQGRPPLPKAKPPSHRPLRFSDSEVNEKAALEAVAAAEVAAGKVEHGRPIELAAARAVATVDSTAGEEHARPPHPTHQQQVNDEQIHGQPHEDGSVKSSDKEDKQIMSNGALAPPAAQADGPSNNGPDASDASVGHKPPSPAGKSSPPQPQLSAPGTGVPPRVLSHALADLVAASPQAMSPTAGLAGEGPSLGQTTASGSGPAPPLELSLCWGLLRPGMSPEEVSAAFAAHRVGAEAFAQAHAEVLSDPRLACRLGGSVFAFASAQLLVIASLAYGPEAAAAMNEPTHFVSYPLKAGVPEGSTSSAGEAPRGTSWRDWLSFGWRSSGTKDEEHLQAQSSSENLDARGAQNAGDRLQGSQLFRSSTGGSRGSDSVPPEQEAALLAAAAGGQASHVQVTEVGGVRRSSTGERSVVLRKRGFVPAAEHLPELGAALKTGKNDIEFTFGRHKLRAYVYLVAWDCRLIISDVDGTITKSDVMGHFGQLLGFDWTHSGVAGLFSAVASNECR